MSPTTTSTVATLNETTGPSAVEHVACRFRAADEQDDGRDDDVDYVDDADQDVDIDDADNDFNSYDADEDDVENDNDYECRNHDNDDDDGDDIDMGVTLPRRLSQKPSSS